MSAVTVAPTDVYSDYGNGVIGLLTPAQLATKYPGMTRKTPTKSFAFPYKGHTIVFHKGLPVMCDAALASALSAASAAVT